METDIQKISETLTSNQTLILEVLGNCQKKLSGILDLSYCQKSLLTYLMSLINSRNDMLGFLNAGVLPEDMQDTLFNIMVCILADIKVVKDDIKLCDLQNLRDGIKPFLSDESKRLFEEYNQYNSQISLQ